MVPLYSNLLPILVKFAYKCFVEKGSQVRLEPVLPGEHGLLQWSWERPAIALAFESASQEEDLPPSPGVQFNRHLMTTLTSALTLALTHSQKMSPYSVFESFEDNAAQE